MRKDRVSPGWKLYTYGSLAGVGAAQRAQLRVDLGWRHAATYKFLHGESISYRFSSPN